MSERERKVYVLEEDGSPAIHEFDDDLCEVGAHPFLYRDGARVAAATPYVPESLLTSALERITELQAELGKLLDEQTKELDAGTAAMNDAAERLAAMNQRLRKLEDCEQDGPVCASPAPGCMRHMLMRNRELLDERNHVLERIAALEAKIAKPGEERAHDTVAW